MKIGFLGAGQMGEALVRGMLKSGFVADPKNIFIFDPNAAQCQKLASELQIIVARNNKEVVSSVELVILAVKPDYVRPVLTEAAPAFTPKHILISIAAGVSINTVAILSGQAAQGHRICRVMPNTPCMVGASASGFALGSGVTTEEGNMIKTLLESVGVAFELPERLLDAVTGLSGSGPAFVAMFIEAMADGGVRAGLPRNVAQSLAAQTVFGTAVMVLNGKHPAVVKDSVCSPGGTTIQGVSQLENGGMRAAVMNAVYHAAERSRELGATSSPTTPKSPT